MKKKILYLYSDTGGGHRSGALAISNACGEAFGDLVEQQMVDVFAYTSSFLGFLSKLYGPIIRYYPKMWKNLFYYFEDMDRIAKLENLGWPFMREEIDKLLEEYKPDILVSTHPVSRMVFRRVVERGMNIPKIAMIMDPYSMHRIWVMPESDLTLVASDHAKRLCVEYGMEEEKVRVVGIPIDPKFPSKAEVKIRHKLEDHLNPQRFTLLLMGGGEGSGKMFEIVQEIENAKLDVQLIVVAGRNESLRKKLEKAKLTFSTPMRIYGFTDQVPELMLDSDIIVTKAGPGTIAEAMAMNLPMVITSYVPGNEEGNVEFVQRERIGKFSEDSLTIVQYIKDLMNSTEFEEFKANIARLRKPNAAADIANIIKSYI